MKTDTRELAMDRIFRRFPDAKARLLRAAAGSLHAQGRSFNEFERLSFRRRGDALMVEGDGRPIVSVDILALIARHDA